MASDVGRHSLAQRYYIQTLNLAMSAGDRLQAAHLVCDDLDQAAAVGRDAVRTAAEVSSTHTLDRLRTLQRQVRPLRTSSRQLGELDERITDLLTRNRARRDEDTTT